MLAAQEEEDEGQLDAGGERLVMRSWTGCDWVREKKSSGRIVWPWLRVPGWLGLARTGLTWWSGTDGRGRRLGKCLMR